ncbi:leucine-rich repeat-containing protein 69-like [Armigeres subalbatus]|uniref:leucine-rich repeat-containing protein 69-like n=1 Tax=Armigeres subalbatus TaxID=124917 RepID=UPI002ED11CF9
MTSKLNQIMSNVEDKIRFHYVCYLVDKCIEENGRKLNLSRSKIKTVPPALAACTFLSKLSLDGNFISSASITGLHSLIFLRYLTLNDNELSEFPEELCELKFVEFLNIGANPIDHLPDSIGKLKNLITLWCNDMLLEQLPEQIGVLRKLKTFGARNNRLKALPESFGELRRLKWLSLENNGIDTLPGSFAKLANLTHLNMARNRFNGIHTTISKLRRLKYCSFEENFIENVTEAALAELDYIKTLLLAGNRIDCTVLTQERVVPFKFDIFNEIVTEDWEFSLPNSELNLLDTSDEETFEEPYEMELPLQARFCSPA